LVDSCTLQVGGTLIAAGRCMSRRTRFLLSIGALTAMAFIGSVDSAAAAPRKKPSAKPSPPPAPSPAAKEAASASFDREAAASAIGSVDLTKCKATNAEKGDGHVMITFSPAGTAAKAVVDKGPWVGTPVAKCFASQFKKTTIPAFGGEPVTVGKSFKFE
jgi:hypothetical protein